MVHKSGSPFCIPFTYTASTFAPNATRCDEKPEKEGGDSKAVRFLEPAVGEGRRFEASRRSCAHVTAGKKGTPTEKKGDWKRSDDVERIYTQMGRWAKVVKRKNRMGSERDEEEFLMKL